MTNAILEYAKLAGQLDSKTNQLNQSLKSTTTSTTITTTTIKQTNNSNKRKRDQLASFDNEFKSSNDSLNSFNQNSLDNQVNNKIENGIIESKLNDVEQQKSEDDLINDEDCMDKKKKENLEKEDSNCSTNSARKEKQSRQVESDIGKLSEQLDNLESDLNEIKKENYESDNLETDVVLEENCAGMDLPNDDLNNNKSKREDQEIKDEQNFNDFYDTNYLNEKHRVRYFRSNSKRILIRNRNGKDKQDSIDFSSTSSSNKGTSSSSSSNSPNDTSLNGNGSDNTTALLSSTTGNDSSTFEDNLGEENRCSSTTSINSALNNGLGSLTGKLKLDSKLALNLIFENTNLN